MKSILRIIAIIVILFSCHISNGQSPTVKGLIRDKFGTPLIGASITIDNNNSSVITDQNGHYKVWLTPGRHYVTISHIGYATQIIIVKVSNEESVKRDFTMTEQYKICKEATVIAQTRSKNNSSINKNLSSDQTKQTEPKMAARQLELPLLNNILDY